MSDKSKEDAVKINISQEDRKEEQDKVKSREEVITEEEKPLEDMTKEELLVIIQELQEKSDRNYDLLLRAKAEMDNILKRNRKEKEDWIKFSNESLIKEILPVIDSIGMAVCHFQNEDSLQACQEGVELTLKGLLDTLKKAGLEEVKAKGESFDPNFHHAVSYQNDDSVDADVILEDLQKGYMLNDRVIRPSMVVVSRGAAEIKAKQK